MKKQHVVLPTMLLVSVLAACGNSLNKDQAVAAAKKIQAYHAADNFAYKTDKLTFTTSIVAGNGVLSAEVRLIKDTYVYSASSMSVPTSEATSSAAINVIEYLYTKDSKYYHVETVGDEVVINTELTQAEFTTLYTGTTGVPGVGSSALASVISAAEGAYTSLNAFITENDTSSSSKAATSVATSAVTSEATSELPIISLTSEEGLSQSYVYASSGDGNLSITANITESNASTHLTGQTAIAFNNYYPEYVTGFSKGTVASGSSEVEEDGSFDMRFKWGECTEINPTISASSSSK